MLKLSMFVGDQLEFFRTGKRTNMFWDLGVINNEFDELSNSPITSSFERSKKQACNSVTEGLRLVFSSFDALLVTSPCPANYKDYISRALAPRLAIFLLH